jgi:hypothetical protein
MSKRRVRVVIAVAVALQTVWGAPPAFAEDKQAEAEKLIRRGVELRRAHDDDAAAREFQKAYDLAPTPRAAGQLGLVKHALGLWEDAERFLGEALRAPNDAWVGKNKAVLDQSMDIIQGHLGRVEVIGDPDGAEVAVNGRRVGKLPLGQAVRVSAGEVDVSVSAPGYSPAQRTVSLTAGQYQRVVFHLAKVESAPASSPAAIASLPSPSLSPSSSPSVSVTAEGSATGPSRTRVALKWTAAGLAAAGVVTGIVGVVMHSNAESAFNAFDSHRCANRDGRGVRSSDGMPDADCQSLLEPVLRDQKILIVGFVAGGAFAATWLALWLTEPTPGARPVQETARRPLCAPTLGALGLSCAGYF